MNDDRKLLVAVEKVLELHHSGKEGAFEICFECDRNWPCETVLAIEGAINE